MLGDTRSYKNIARIKQLGWGRMFAGSKPNPWDGERWGFDNGAYYNWTHGMPFDDLRFEYRLKVAREIGTPEFAVVPDIVAAGCSSLEFSLKWREKLPDDWKWYLAVQDGMTIHDVRPYLPRFDGIFLGGSDTFKQQAWRWRVFAKDNGKPFHFARAGTLPKLESALKMKADSLDSTYPLWENTRLDKFVAMYEYLQHSPRPQLIPSAFTLEIA